MGFDLVVQKPCEGCLERTELAKRLQAMQTEFVRVQTRLEGVEDERRWGINVLVDHVRMFINANQIPARSPIVLSSTKTVQAPSLFSNMSNNQTHEVVMEKFSGDNALKLLQSACLACWRRGSELVHRLFSKKLGYVYQPPVSPEKPNWSFRVRLSKNNLTCIRRDHWVQ